MRKEFVFITAAICIMAGSSFGATQLYGYKSQFNSSAAGDIRGTQMCADTSGGVYLCDNNSDKIWYVPTPLTATGASGDFVAVYDATTPADPYGSGSWNGISIDSAGTIFASGHDATKSIIAKIVRTGPTAWTTTLFNSSVVGQLPASIELLGGCAAVGVNRIAVPGLTTGNLHFLTVGASVTEDASSPIAATGFTGNATDVAYDAANGKIYMCHNVTSTSTGGVHVFNSNGTAPGTTYPTGASNNPLVADTTGSTANGVSYQSIDVQSADRTLVVNRNNATAPDWELIDASAAAPVTPYQSRTNAGSPAGAVAAGDTSLGSAFFSVSGTKYLITGTNNTPRQFTVYQATPAAVAEWNLY